MSEQPKSEPVEGRPGHIIQMILLLAAGAAVVILGILFLWWGGFWGIIGGIGWSLLASGLSHQAGVGRGYRMGKPTKISMSDESWEK